jgi:hypothetical protein
VCLANISRRHGKVKEENSVEGVDRIMPGGARRAGIERIITRGIRSTGLRGTRSIGLARVRLGHILTPVGLNALRLRE